MNTNVRLEGRCGLRGARKVNQDDIYLDARAVFLIEHLRLPARMQRFYIRAVEIALEHLEDNSPGRCARSGWIDMLFAAMERRVERSPHGGREDFKVTELLHAADKAILDEVTRSQICGRSPRYYRLLLVRAT
jgi:hypothetical protein